MWWLSAVCLSQLSSVLVAKVQTEATMMLGTTKGEKEREEGKKESSVKSPGGQLLNQGQDIICNMPSGHKIWGRANFVQ